MYEKPVFAFETCKHFISVQILYRIITQYYVKFYGFVSK